MEKYRKRKPKADTTLSKEDLKQLIAEKKEEIQYLEDRLEREKKMLAMLNAYAKGNMDIIQPDSEQETPTTQQDTKSQPAYDETWTWKQKILFTLSSNDCPLLSSQIIKHLKQLEPYLFQSRDEGRTISAQLNRLIKSGFILTHKEKVHRGYYYLLPEWADDNRNLQKKYRERIQPV